jgi:hypothetical protein
MASGIVHLLCPGAFESVNRMAFKTRIRARVLINGSIEAVALHASDQPPQIAPVLMHEGCH